MMNGTGGAPTTIYVVRHGATKLNNDTDLSEDRIRGWANVPLAPDGKKEAVKAAEQLKQFGIQVIVSSDLVRALETAQIIGQILGVPVQPSHKLRPWNLGNFTGTSTKDALPKIAVYVQQKPAEPVPGGESFNQFKERALQGVAEAIQAAKGRPLAIVTHHRDERLLKAWQAAGEPPTHEIDLDVFLQKGDPPGGVFEMPINAAALMSAGPPQMPASLPGGAQAPGGAPAGGPPGPGTPPPAAGGPPPPGGSPPPPGGQQPPNQLIQLFAVMAKINKAIDLLRQDIPRGYRIEIEIDTMVAGDIEQEREDATNFLGAVTKFIETAGMMVQQSPDFAPLAAKMLQWGVRRFRTGRDLEQAIDEFADKVTKETQANAGKPKPPTAEQSKAQSEQVKAQAEIGKAKLDMQSQQQNDQREQQLKVLEFQLEQKKMAFEMQMKEREFQMKEREMQMKMQLAEHQAHIQERKNQADLQMQAQQHQFDAAAMAREEQFKQAEHGRKEQLAAKTHSARMSQAEAPGP